MKFDTFLDTINDWGKFQKVKYTLICLTYMLPPIMVYSYTFTAAVPKFRCSNPEFGSSDIYGNDTYESLYSKYKPTEEQCKSAVKKVSIKECQRCYVQSYNNSELSTDSPLKSCATFSYDRSKYKKTLVEEWGMVCDQTKYKSYAQMVFFVGYMVGSLLFGALADKFGRRPIMGISFFLMTAAGFLCAYGPQESFGTFPSYIVFVAARFLLACATRGISVSGFVLGSEIVGPRKRLLAGIVIEYFFAFGQLFLVLFAYFIRTWRTLSAALALFTTPFLLFYLILPESPRWLVSRGRFDEAEKILRSIAATNKREFNTEAFEQVKEEQKISMSNKHNQEGVMSLFRSRIMFILSMNLFFQWLVQNLVFYGVSQNTGSWDLDPYLSFMIGAVVELIAYIVVHLILDHLGRKIPYCSFALLFGIIALLILPAQKFTVKNSLVQRGLFNAINISLRFFASASYAIIYIYANELFPTNVRNTGMGICSMVARIGAIIGTYCNDAIARIWIHLPIILYGSASLIAAVLALMFPETLNKLLPQTVADTERMFSASAQNGKLQSTNTDGTEREGQPLTEKDECMILKSHLLRNNVEDIHV